MTEALTKLPSVAELKTTAQALLDEDVSLVAAKFHLRHEETMRLLDAALSEAHPGTKTYLDHLLARERLMADYISTRQSLGLLPQSLGTSTVQRYEFKATVGLSPDSGRRTTMFNPPTIDAEVE